VLRVRMSVAQTAATADDIDDDDDARDTFFVGVRYFQRQGAAIDIDLPTGIELTIDRLDNGRCWNAFRFRKAG
jgi:hypothetical protein